MSERKMHAHIHIHACVCVLSECTPLQGEPGVLTTSRFGLTERAASSIAWPTCFGVEWQLSIRSPPKSRASLIRECTETTQARARARVCVCVSRCITCMRQSVSKIRQSPSPLKMDAAAVVPVHSLNSNGPMPPLCHRLLWLTHSLVYSVM